MVKLNAASTRTRMRRNHKVKRVRIYIGLFPQCIAIATDRLKQTRPAMSFELLTQMTNVDFQHMGVNVGMIAPDALQNLFPTKDLSWVAHEEQQERVFLSRQFDQVSVSVYFSGRLIELQVGIYQGFTSGLVTTQHGPNAGDQFVEGERFGDVVIGTQVQRIHLIRHLVTRREHNDGDIVLESQAAAHLEAIEAGHGDIQQDDMWFVLFGCGETGFSIHRGIYFEPLIGKATLE